MLNSTTRPRNLRFFTLLVSCLLVSTAAARPNFVIIMADDLGYGDISCFEGWVDTPRLDQLAGEGLRLTDYHSNGAVCSPTRAALMTGRYQQRVGVPGVIVARRDAAVHRTGIGDSEVTFAEALRQQGYATAIYGKWHLGYLPQFNPVRHGFDEFHGYISGNVDFFSHIDQAGHLDWWQNDKLRDEAGYVTHLITEHAVRFIQQNQKRPFCLYLRAMKRRIIHIRARTTRRNGRSVGLSSTTAHERTKRMPIAKWLRNWTQASVPSLTN